MAKQKYQDAVRQHRLSDKLWWAQHNYAQGEKLSDMVGDGDVSFDDLDESQQQLVHDFDTRRLKKHWTRSSSRKLAALSRCWGRDLDNLLSSISTCGDWFAKLNGRLLAIQVFFAVLNRLLVSVNASMASVVLFWCFLR